ncbi:MAG: aldose 1-epimerase [Leptospiraceae bacterium]|nr:aldose 1-epimerase [Leptospiraceae bacterium]MCP5494346.1 aldose 1-epimerase [Leptospiraceae bacterium]
MYNAKQSKVDNLEVVELEDNRNSIKAKIALNLGNTLYELSVNQENILYFPASLHEYSSSKSLHGNPFLYPWANRLEGDYFYFQNKLYDFQKNPLIFRDKNGFPLHGLLLKSPYWKTSKLYHSNSEGAIHVASLDFAVHPELMEVFPFKHTIEMIHTLKDGKITIQVVVKNTGTTDMPVSFGFHPYFSISSSERKDSFVTLPVQTEWELNSNLLPTGKQKGFWNKGNKFRLGDLFLDFCYGDFWEQEDGYSHFLIETKNRVVEINFGGSYKTAVVFAPLEKPFVCIEPMTSPTNGINLYHKGLWKRLPIIKPGEFFQAEFSIKIK